MATTHTITFELTYNDDTDPAKARADIREWARNVVVTASMAPDVEHITASDVTTKTSSEYPRAQCFRKSAHAGHDWGQYQDDKYTKHCRGTA